MKIFDWFHPRVKPSQGFPARCIRGIRDQGMITPDGFIHSHAFEPVETEASQKKRRDAGKSPWCETSINWEDHEYSALKTTYDDERNAKAGIVFVPLSNLELARAHPTLGTNLSWERDPLTKPRANPFHGNILFSVDIERRRRKEIAAVIAAGLDKPLTRNQVQAQLEKYNANQKTLPPKPSTWLKALLRWLRWRA
jgi:hypothetical protein